MRSVFATRNRTFTPVKMIVDERLIFSDAVQVDVLGIWMVGEVGPVKSWEQRGGYESKG